MALLEGKRVPSVRRTHPIHHLAERALFLRGLPLDEDYERARSPRVSGQSGIKITGTHHYSGTVMLCTSVRL